MLICSRKWQLRLFLGASSLPAVSWLTLREEGRSAGERLCLTACQLVICIVLSDSVLPTVKCGAVVPLLQTRKRRSEGFGSFAQVTQLVRVGARNDL